MSPERCFNSRTVLLFFDQQLRADFIVFKSIMELGYGLKGWTLRFFLKKSKIKKKIKIKINSVYFLTGLIMFFTYFLFLNPPALG